MLGNFANALKEKYSNSDFARKLNNKEFKEGFAAVCALVATSDGNAGDDEYQRYDELIDSQDALRVFKKAELHTLFEGFVGKCKFNKREVWKEFDQVPDELKPNLIDMMIGMAAAEGGMDDKEKATIQQAISRGRLNAREWPEVAA